VVAKLLGVGLVLPLPDADVDVLALIEAVDESDVSPVNVIDG